MNTLYFEDYEDFVCAFVDKYDEVTEYDELNAVDVIAKYVDAKEIIKELICMRYDIESIDIGDCDVNGYDDEYVISLMEDSIWCEPAKRDDGYIWIEADVCYVLSDCNSKILKKIEANEVHEVEIEGEYDCDGNCENCECKSSTTSNAIYKVNGKEVSKSDYEKSIENIEEKYLDLDGIRDMLLRYCEIQDEMNEWRKLLRW